jgi:hypothetical protein
VGCGGGGGVLRWERCAGDGGGGAGGGAGWWSGQGGIGLWRVCAWVVYLLVGFILFCVRVRLGVRVVCLLRWFFVLFWFAVLWYWLQSFVVIAVLVVRVCVACRCYVVRVICLWCLILFFVLDCPFWLLLFFVFELGFWVGYLLLLIGRVFFIFVLVVDPGVCPLSLNLAFASDVVFGGCSLLFIVVVARCSLVVFRELVVCS